MSIDHEHAVDDQADHTRAASARRDAGPTSVTENRWRWRRPRLPITLLTICVVIALWQLFTVVLKVPSYLVPEPSEVAKTLASNSSVFLQETEATGKEVIFGFAFSVVIGTAIAILIVSSRVLERVFYPLIVTSQTIPVLAIAPIVLVWFGFGMWPKVGIVVLIAFFPIVINSVIGFKSVPEEMIQLAASMGAGRLTRFRKIVLPNALPNIFSGMKLASTLCVIGAVVAEFVGADAGLGYLINEAAGSVNLTEEFGAVFILSVMGIVFFTLVGLAERLTIPWHVSVRRNERINPSNYK
jgi:NitT/TauT family transport system permease protein